MTHAGAQQAPHDWGTAPEFVGPRHALREQLLLRALLQAGPGRRVLDAGAGGGTFATLLRARGFDVAVADASEAAVDVLSSRGFDAIHAGVERMPFDDGAFDVVVLGEVLEHVERDDCALAEAARVLVPGGVLALSVPRNPAWFGPSDRWAGHVRRYTRDELVESVRSAGFAGLRCKAWGFPVSALYHRKVYEPRLARRGAQDAARAPRVAVAMLGLALQIDRLFVGVERGALGYLLTATSR